MTECKPVGTPLDPHTVLSKDMGPVNDTETKEMRRIPYLAAVGSLMYLATTTRPDISYAVGVLARFNSNPGPEHWTAVKHLQRYLKGTLDYKLVYGPNDDNGEFLQHTLTLITGNKDDGNSTGNFVTHIRGEAIGWRSCLQPMVTINHRSAVRCSS